MQKWLSSFHLCSISIHTSGPFLRGSEWSSGSGSPKREVRPPKSDYVFSHQMWESENMIKRAVFVPGTFKRRSSPFMNILNKMRYSFQNDISVYSKSVDSWHNSSNIYNSIYVHKFYQFEFKLFDWCIKKIGFTLLVEINEKFQRNLKPKLQYELSSTVMERQIYNWM